MKLFHRRPAKAMPAPDNLVRVHVEQLPEIEVRHVIERRIPRPTSVTFRVMRADGSMVQLMSLDLSYRNSFPLRLPMGMILNDRTMPDLELHAELHYEARYQT